MPVRHTHVLFALLDAWVRTKNMLIWRRSDALERASTVWACRSFEHLGLCKRQQVPPEKKHRTAAWLKEVPSLLRPLQFSQILEAA